MPPTRTAAKTATPWNAFNRPSSPWRATTRRAFRWKARTSPSPAAIVTATSRNSTTPRPISLPICSCAGCHLDPHQTQVRGGDRRHGRRAATACEACHNVRTWRQVASFDHSKTQLPAHRIAPRRGLRGMPPRDGAFARRAQAGLPGRAAGLRGLPRGCACRPVRRDLRRPRAATRCHDNTKWKPGKFDHQRTGFSLEGAHERVPCKDCHNSRKEVNGRMVVFYKPAPKDCVSCHGPKLKN